MTADNVSQGVSRLSQSLEELRAKCTANPANAPEILSDALEIAHFSLYDPLATERKQSERTVQVSEKAKEAERKRLNDLLCQRNPSRPIKRYTGGYVPFLRQRCIEGNKDTRLNRCQFS